MREGERPEKEKEREEKDAERSATVVSPCRFRCEPKKVFFGTISPVVLFLDF